MKAINRHLREPKVGRPGKFERLFETAPEAIVVIREDGRITLANDQLQKMFGYP